MKRNTFNNLGGLQSIFFCIGVYAVSLFFSIFICSSIFYALNPKKTAVIKSNIVSEKPVYASVGK